MIYFDNAATGGRKPDAVIFRRFFRRQAVRKSRAERP